MNVIVSDVVLTLVCSLLLRLRIGFRPLILAAAAIAIFILLLAVYIALLFILSLFVNLNKPQKRINRFYRAFLNETMGLALGVCRIHIKTKGLELVPPNCRYLIVCNHRSNFDPIIMAWVLRGRELAFISKPENFRIPICGQFIHMCCYLPIDRKNNRKAMLTIKEASELISGNVTSIGIFPEGTRNMTSETLLDFHAGAFKIATRNEVPIIVAVMHGTGAISKRAPLKATNVTFEIADVIYPSEYKGKKTVEISADVQKIMRNSLEK